MPTLRRVAELLTPAAAGPLTDLVQLVRTLTDRVARLEAAGRDPFPSADIAARVEWLERAALPGARSSRQRAVRGTASP